MWLHRLRRRGMPTGSPLAEAAVEETCLLVSKPCEDPPGPRTTRAVVAHYGVGRAYPQRASGHGKLLRRTGIGDATRRPEGAVREEHRPRDVPRGIVLGAPGIDDLDIGVVQVLGEPGGADQQAPIGVIAFRHPSCAPHSIGFSFLHY